ncbi:MAG: TetR/AcrR family transcriptional regulator [Cyclobacteriaceae bacterium]
MAGRNRTFNETDVLEKAADLFWKQGYEATSTEELLEVMGLNKGSLYNTFHSKKEVFIRSMKGFVDSYIKNFDREMAASNEPLKLIGNSFLKVATTKDLQAHADGCFMGNAIAEFANIDPELEKIAVTATIKLEKLYLKYLKIAKKSGQLQSREKPEVLARYLVNLWNGINITRRMYPNEKELMPFIKTSLEVIR